MLLPRPPTWCRQGGALGALPHAQGLPSLLAGETDIAPLGRELRSQELAAWAALKDGSAPREIRLAAMGAAVSADVAAVEGGCIACPSSLGQRGEHGFPEAAPRPAVETVVDRRARVVGYWAVAPAATRTENT